MGSDERDVAQVSTGNEHIELALGNWFTRYEVIRRCPDVISEDLQWSRSGPGKASQELLPSCRGRGVVLDVARREPQTTWWPDET